MIILQIALVLGMLAIIGGVIQAIFQFFCKPKKNK